MLTQYDLIDNLEKEQEYIESEYNIENICKEYSEPNLLFYETGNRMSGLGGILFLRKDNINRIIYIDEENDLLYKTFPIAMNLTYKDNLDNNKYNYINTGFGGKLFIDKSIYNIFYNNIKSLQDKNNLGIDNTLNEQLVHAYWLTIARDML